MESAIKYAKQEVKNEIGDMLEEILDINEKEILLGVSPNGVSKLALLEGTEIESDEIQDKALTEPSVKKSSFKDKIAEVLK